MGRTVIVLGGGVGGVVAASSLRRLLPEQERVVLIERTGQHVFWPSLPWLVTGTRKVHDVQRPLHAIRAGGVDVRQGEVASIDPARRSVRIGDETLTADALVISLGAQLAPERIPGLVQAGHVFYSVEGATSLHRALQGMREGRVVVLIAGVPFKCPAAPYEAAMLIEHYLRKRRVRERVQVDIYAAEASPMGVAGPVVSRGVRDLVAQRGIGYHPSEQVTRVDPQTRRLHFASGAQAPFDVLAAVPPHVAPDVVRQAGLASQDGWLDVDRGTLETRFPDVFAIGDVTGIMLAMGKPLPKAGVFAHAQAQAVARTIAARWTGKGKEERFDGRGECFIEMGDGSAGFARGNFYADPTPDVRLFRPGRHWHAAKVALERTWWRTWF